MSVAFELRYARFELTYCCYYICEWICIKDWKTVFWSVLCFPFLMMPRFSRLLVCVCVFFFSLFFVPHSLSLVSTGLILVLFVCFFSQMFCSFFWCPVLRFFPLSLSISLNLYWTYGIISSGWLIEKTHAIFGIETICTNFRNFSSVFFFYILSR